MKKADGYLAFYSEVWEMGGSKKRRVALLSHFDRKDYIAYNLIFGKFN